MKQIYTTLFNSCYLAKGIALCRSLEKVCDDYHMYIFAFDNDTERILSAMCSNNITIIPLADLEAYYPALREVKQSRGVGEYCWTCKGPSIQYVFDVYSVDNCAYLDSDLYFYQSPALILKDITDDTDVVLTPHNYHKDYDLTLSNGYYCAQYLWFKNNENGRCILNWWTDLCIDWCYGHHASGRFGDQKYLELFPKKWQNVLDTKINGCCAPWNINKFRLQKNGNLLIKDKKTYRIEPIVFYHFHFLKTLRFSMYDEFSYGPYNLNKSVVKKIYIPYIKEILLIDNSIKQIRTDINSLGALKIKYSMIMQILHFIKTKLISNNFFCC